MTAANTAAATTAPADTAMRPADDWAVVLALAALADALELLTRPAVVPERVTADF